MASKAIIGGGIAAAIAIVFVIFVVSSDTISNVSPETAEKELIPSNDPVDVIDFTAVQFGDVITLNMTIGAAMPDTFHDISLSDSAIGFGYGWFGIKGSGEGHLEGGIGHLLGYIVMITEDESEWKAVPVKLDLITPTKAPYSDACVSIYEYPADFSVDDNIITLTNGPDNRPYVNAFFIDRIASFEILPNINDWCHENQYFMRIIDIYNSEET